MSGNAVTIGQTQVHRQGASCERHVCAAASCHCHDLVLWPTAGKTEFVKSEPPLMRKNTDSYPTHQPANWKAELPWERRRQQSSKAVLNTRVHTQAAENRAVQGRMHAHARSPVEAECQVASGCRVCTCYVCVCGWLSAFTLLGPFAACARACA